MGSVHDALGEADLVDVLADATRDTPDTLSIGHLPQKPTLLFVNKMDKIPQEQALPLVEKYLAAFAFEAVVPISALKGTNLDVALGEILERLPLGPPFYPKDLVSEHPERFFIAEIVREKIFEQFRQEVPYSTQVNIVQYEEREGKDFIDAEIVVERDTQKGILIGKTGAALKRLGTAARRDIEEFVGGPVYLQLHVKVRGDWRNKDTFLRSYGY